MPAECWPTAAAAGSPQPANAKHCSPDRGCTFPGCTRSAAQSEIHHATDWATGGHTNLDTMAIACGYHNTEAPKQNWRTIMINGIPHWKPPPWHPQQEPQRNYLHHPELLRTPPG